MALKPGMACGMSLEVKQQQLHCKDNFFSHIAQIYRIHKYTRSKKEGCSFALMLEINGASNRGTFSLPLVETIHRSITLTEKCPMMIRMLLVAKKNVSIVG